MPAKILCPERVQCKSTDDWVDAPWWEWDEEWNLWKCVLCGKWNKKDNSHLTSTRHKESLSQQGKLDRDYPDVKSDTVETRSGGAEWSPTAAAAASQTAATAQGETADAAASPAMWKDGSGLKGKDGTWVLPPACGSKQRRDERHSRGRSSSPRTWGEKEGGGAAAAAASPPTAYTGKAWCACFAMLRKAACPARSHGNDPGGPGGAAAEPLHQGGAATAEPGQEIQHGPQAPADEEASENPDRTSDTQRGSEDVLQKMDLLQCLRVLRDRTAMLHGEVTNMRRAQEGMQNDLAEMKTNVEILNFKRAALLSKGSTPPSAQHAQDRSPQRP